MQQVCEGKVLYHTMTDNEDESMQDYDAATAGQNVKESREKELVPNIGIRGVKHFIENLKRRLRNLGKKAEALIPKKSAEAKANKISTN